MLVLLFGALWFILRGDLLYILPCAIFFLCFSVLLALRLPRLGKRELILVLFVHLIDLCLFGFIGFLFLLVSAEEGGGMWGLRFVALPGLFSYLFSFIYNKECNKSITILEDFTFQLDSPKQFLSLIRIYTGCFSVLDFD